jgi:hypothetical protein
MQGEAYGALWSIVMAFGMKFHGRRWRRDGTYVTTEWFVLALIPIFPVRSVLIVDALLASVYLPKLTRAHQVPLDKEIVFSLYSYMLGSVAA